MDKVKHKIKSWLEIRGADPTQIHIDEILDFEGNAIKNRIWYRGDSNELEQLYGQIDSPVDRYKFWASKSTPGQEIRKIHTGLPGLIVDVLSSIVLEDLNSYEFKDPGAELTWKEIEEDNDFSEQLEDALKQILYVGDGAFKVTFDSSVSDLPMLEFYPGDQIDIVYNRGRMKEVIFKIVYFHGKKRYVLHETYGYGYIKYQLLHNGKEVDVTEIPQTEKLVDLKFAGYSEDAEGNMLSRGAFCMAVPIMVYKNSKWPGRGHSIFDKKIDNFDAYDEAWSQWMDALRAGRAKTYIPECFIPRDQETGEILLKPNSFDNRFIKVDNNAGEDANNKIETEQPDIPGDNYLSAYTTALDQAIQGIISPSTLGIDMKKLDNAEAQREKEKATLYSRNAIVKALRKYLPTVVDTVIKALQTYRGEAINDTEVKVQFGEYANPSFESQVETVGKGKTYGILSIEAAVDELYGDSKDEAWKEMEIARLKAEQGIIEEEEPPKVNDYE